MIGPTPVITVQAPIDPLPHLYRPRVAPILEKIVQYGVMVLLAFGVLAFGAVETWSTFVLEAGAATLFLLWLAGRVLSGAIVVRTGAVLLPVASFAGLVAIQLLFGLTAYPYVTRSEAMLYLAYGLLLFVTYQVFGREDDLRRFAVFMSVFGFLLAIFAIAQSITYDGKIYWIHTAPKGAIPFGPYVNHNHYAGIMEMLTAIPLVLALSGRIRGALRAVAAFAAILMALSIVLSLSRGGIIAFSAELVFLLGMFLYKRRAHAGAIAVGAIVVLVIGMALWMGVDPVVQRFEVLRNPSAEPSFVTRMAFSADSLRMWKDKPVLGWGLGVLPTVYPRYRTIYANVFVNEAHDDYVQLLAETGVLGFCLMVWFVVLVIRGGTRDSLRRSPHIGAVVQLGVVSGIVGLLVHSFVDFNLQIPANAATFYVFSSVAALRRR